LASITTSGSPLTKHTTSGVRWCVPWAESTSISSVTSHWIGGRVGPVDHRNRRLVLLAVGHELGDRDAQRQLAVQPLVGRQQPFGQAQRRQLAHDLFDAAAGQRVPLTLVLVAAGLQHLDQARPQQHLARAAAHREGLGRGQEVPAEVAQQVQRREVRSMLLI
jgi:hypothetical protein